MKQAFILLFVALLGCAQNPTAPAPDFPVTTTPYRGLIVSQPIYSVQDTILYFSAVPIFDDKSKVSLDSMYVNLDTYYQGSLGQSIILDPRQNNFSWAVKTPECDSLTGIIYYKWMIDNAWKSETLTINLCVVRR